MFHHKKPTTEILMVECNRLLTMYYDGDSTAHYIVHRHFSEETPITKAVIKEVVAREYGFKNWSQLLASAINSDGRF